MTVANETEKKKSNKGWLWALIIFGVIVGLALSCLAGAVAGFAVGRISGRQATMHLEMTPMNRWWNQDTLPDELPDELPARPTMIQGALVREVLPDSPAKRADLQIGDVITAVEGQYLDGDSNLSQIIQRYQPGDEVEISLWRAGETIQILLTLDEHPELAGRAYLGVTVAPVTLPDLDRFQNYDSNGD